MEKRWITVDRKGITFHGRLGGIVNAIVNLVPTIALIGIMIHIALGNIQSAILTSCLLILFKMIFKESVKDE